MNDGVRLADVGKELVSETFAFAGALDESGYIDDLHGRRNDTAFGITYLAEFDQTLIRHGDYAHVRLYRAERKISALRFGIAQTVKEGTLAYIRQTHYSTL